MTIYKQNIHTHTKFCDGKNTPEEMVERAIELGFDTIGFSGHSNTQFDIDWHMTPENNQLYIDEIKRLKEKYQGRIDVLLGLEYEMYSGTSAEGYDYVIGATDYSLVTTIAAKTAIKNGVGFLSLPLHTNDDRSMLEYKFMQCDTAQSKELAKRLTKARAEGTRKVLEKNAVIEQKYNI